MVSRAVRRMQRHRVGVVWLCLIALVWCQFAAATSYCLVETTGGDPGGAAMSLRDATKSDCGAGRSDCCPATQTLKYGSLDATLALLPLLPERFTPVLSFGAASVSARQTESGAPLRPPPHFLGRLLI
ncbi:MAG: hypothetical protein JSS16_00535 [Proteobacteria bacterium]|jgi:hypothetical protein|nr:hypothetical protein [Pseudomonadota bacterium]